MKRTIQQFNRKSALLLLFALLSSFIAVAQSKKITGTVIDENNQPLPGASIKAKGGPATAVADLAGNFTITIPASEKALIVTFIGYNDQEVQISGQSHLSIRLTQSSKNLNDVVVIGYGTQRREAVTGSVASISGDRIRDIPAPNISQAIQGRLPGVEVSQTSTKPGATMQILIRGQRSLTASNDPLIVLDGIPFTGSIGDINPNDVKSVDVLKDASATAIYGSRGANGVILVTTNR
ncbi:MAG: TonB-dependent receptor plug domain-containing protein, partial [Mucilaginibacter sp.]